MFTRRASYKIDNYLFCFMGKFSYLLPTSGLSTQEVSNSKLASAEACMWGTLTLKHSEVHIRDISGPIKGRMLTKKNSNMLYKNVLINRSQKKCTWGVQLFTRKVTHNIFFCYAYFLENNQSF